MQHHILFLVMVHDMMVLQNILTASVENQGTITLMQCESSNPLSYCLQGMYKYHPDTRETARTSSSVLYFIHRLYFVELLVRNFIHHQFLPQSCNTETIITITPITNDFNLWNWLFTMLYTYTLFTSSYKKVHRNIHQQKLSPLYIMKW